MAPLPDMIMIPSEAARSNYDLALALAGEGFFTFPCQPDGPGEKRPFNGVMWAAQSTKDESRISSWWERWPDAMPGLDLKKSGLIVIDLDGQFGIDDWRELTAGREPDDAPIVSTPSGGQHWYFRQPDGFSLGNGRGTLPAKRVNPATGKAQGIDVRGAGGYVIAPGSMKGDGRYYVPERGDFTHCPVIPDWLVEILKGGPPSRPSQAYIAPAAPPSGNRLASYGHAALDEEANTVAMAAPGTRNETVNTSAFRLGQLVGGGCLSEREAYDAMASAVLSWGVKPNDKALGQRGTIQRALKAGMAHPRTVPDDPADSRTLVDISGLLVDKETGEIFEPAPPIKISDPYDEFSRPPGLLGEIVDWITDTSDAPQRGIALGAALAVIGTAAGRHIAGPTRSGTHLYIMGLAPSGGGKDRPRDAIAQLLTAAKMQHHIGPGQFMSMPAVINLMRRSPVTCCAIDEFGSFLKRINNRKASGFESAISGELRKLWSGSFKVHMTPEWAGKSAEAIHAPAMTIFGTSTAEEFYGALEGGDTSNGVLNRFIIFSSRTRPAWQDITLDPFKVPERISKQLALIYTRPGELATAQRNQADLTPFMFQVPWGPGGEEVYKAFRQSTVDEGDRYPEARDFIVRRTEIAIRLATIRAVGENIANPCVDAACMEWAAGLASLSAETMMEGAKDYISDTDVQAEAQRVIRIVREKGGMIRHRDLLRALNGRLRSRDLKDILAGLLESEMLYRVEERSGKTRQPTTIYALAKPSEGGD